MVHKVFIDFKKVLFEGHCVDNYEGDYPTSFKIIKNTRFKYYLTELFYYKLY